MVKYLCIIQARVNSSRLPAKVMLDLDGKTLLERVYQSVQTSTKIDKIIVATSNENTDDIIELKLSTLGVTVYRGSLNNVLERFYDAAKKYKAVNIIRVTADNPLMDGNIIDELITIYEKNKCNYSMFSNAVYGLSAEIFSFHSLEKANTFARNDFDKEHVTPYIKKKKKVYIKDIKKEYRKPNISATIDTINDYIKMQQFYLNCTKNSLEVNIDNFILWEEESKNA